MHLRDLFTRKRGQREPSRKPDRNQRSPDVAPPASSRKGMAAATTMPRLGCEHIPSRVHGSSRLERWDASKSRRPQGEERRLRHSGTQVCPTYSDKRFAKTAPGKSASTGKPASVYNEQLRTEAKPQCSYDRSSRRQNGPGGSQPSQAKTVSQKYYPALVDMSDHPSKRPLVPPRPPEGIEQKTGRPDTPSMSSATASDRSSSCVSTSTAATSLLSEPNMPLNLRLEGLRQYRRMGFFLDAPIKYPRFGPSMGRAKPRVDSYCFQLCEDGETGRISAKAHSIFREGGTVVFPRNITVAALLKFESGRSRGGGRALAKGIIDLLLLSDDLVSEDVPYVLPCFYWIRRHLNPQQTRLPALLRMQCNARQRRVFATFAHLSSIEEDAVLAKALTSRDPYDNSLRLCAFLELYIEHYGTLGVLKLLERIKKGRQGMQYDGWKVDHLCKASPESIGHLVVTIVHGLGQRLAARRSCLAHQMQDVADALSLILTLSGEMDVARVFYGVVPMLQAGEIALCYSLLLATSLAGDDHVRQMWDLLERSVGLTRSCVDVVLATTAVTYLSGEGSEVLFPGLYRELVKRNLQAHAKEAWKCFGGDPVVWTALEVKVRSLWKVQSEAWWTRAQAG